MSDDKSMKDNRDRSKVSGSEEYEVNYFVQKLGVTRDQVMEAIKKIGNDRQKLEAFLKGK